MPLSPSFRSFLQAASILFLCVWYLSQYGKKLADTTLSYIAYPCYALSQRVHGAATAWHERRRSHEELLATLHAAEQQCAALRAELVTVRAGAVYTEAIAPLVDFYKRYEQGTAIVAQVLTLRCSDAEQMMIIDAGAQKGVQQDMVVLAANGLLGRVVEVFPWYSRVMLVTDRRCKIPVVCAQTKTDAIYEGANTAYEGTLSFVSCLQPLVVGDHLLTSGKGMLYPAGFAVGTLSEVTHDAQGLYYTAKVTPYCDPYAISQCLVVSKGSL